MPVPQNLDQYDPLFHNVFLFCDHGWGNEQITRTFFEGAVFFRIAITTYRLDEVYLTAGPIQGIPPFLPE
jgi:hypothetical protein